MITTINYIEILLTMTLRVSPPLIFAGLAGMLSFRAGLLNIALEGMMLFGAFTAVIGSYYMGSGILGMLAAGIVGGGLPGSSHFSTSGSKRITLLWELRSTSWLLD